MEDDFIDNLLLHGQFQDILRTAEPSTFSSLIRFSEKLYALSAQKEMADRRILDPPYRYDATVIQARSTLPERRHAVHTCIFLVPPSTFTETVLTLEFQIRFDLLCEWLTLLPK
jgi:hypothetical protein